MAKYGFFNCPDCGKRTPKTSPNKKRCKPCALAAHGETKSGFRPRKCVVCDGRYKPKSASQKACPGCAEEYAIAARREYRRAKRDALGRPAKGDLIDCMDCGQKFEYVAGPQVRCSDCQYAAYVAAIRDWSSRHPEKMSEYRQRAKDNYDFGGNRIAALERDNFTCQGCGSTDALHVHHIDGLGTTTPRDQRNNALENLQTLCASCHMSLHIRDRHSSCSPPTRSAEDGLS